MGITSDRSPIFLHHINDLGGTRRDPQQSIIALAGLQKSMMVIGITIGDYSQDRPDAIKVPPFSKLVSVTTPMAFKKFKTASKCLNGRDLRHQSYQSKIWKQN
jgi:hypothetical protein